MAEYEDKLNNLLNPFGLFAKAFAVSSYNTVRTSQKIPTKIPNPLGILIYSNKNFFTHIAKVSNTCPNIHFVEHAVSDIINKINQTLNPNKTEPPNPEFRETLNPKFDIYNTDSPIQFHVQTIGHVAGIDQHIEGTEVNIDTPFDLKSLRDDAMWGSNIDRIFGLNIHPIFGGWYAYRILIVFQIECKIETPPLNFLSEKEKELAVFSYNFYPNESEWRDVHCTKGFEYDPFQFLYFHEKRNSLRKRALELWQIANA